MCILQTEEKYDDNTGAFSLAYEWNGEKVITRNYANGYDLLNHGSITVDATEKDRIKAKEWLKTQEQTYKTVGQKYAVKYSRKFKRGTIVEVVSVFRDGFNNELARVKSDTETHDISVNCLDEFVSGVMPKWWVH